MRLPCRSKTKQEYPASDTDDWVCSKRRSKHWVCALKIFGNVLETAANIDCQEKYNHRDADHNDPLEQIGVNACNYAAANTIESQNAKPDNGAQFWGDPENAMHNNPHRLHLCP